MLATFFIFRMLKKFYFLVKIDFFLYFLMLLMHILQYINKICIKMIFYEFIYMFFYHAKYYKFILIFFTFSFLENEKY